MSDQTKDHRHISIEERLAIGKNLRKQAPRSSHGDWDPVHLTGPIRSICSRHRIRVV